MLSTVKIYSQSWPPSGLPSNPCGDIYLVPYQFPNGDLEIEVNYHGASALPIGLLSVDLYLEGLSVGATLTNPSTGTIGNQPTTATVTLSPLSAGTFTYDCTANSGNGYSYNLTDQPVTLFKIKYENNLSPYTGGCVNLSCAAIRKEPDGTLCTPIPVFAVGGTSLPVNIGGPKDNLPVYKFCANLQSGQLLNISGNVSRPPMWISTCKDPITGKPTPPLQSGIPTVDISFEDINGHPYCNGVGTDQAGDYTSCNLPTQDYKIGASKKCQGKYNGCLSTADAVQIVKFTNGLIPFQPWQFMAADINGDGEVTFNPLNNPSNGTDDANMLSNLVLYGNNNTLKDCWIFYPTTSQSDYDLAMQQVNVNPAGNPNPMQTIFQNNGNTWSKKISWVNPTSSTNGQNFYGVQKGDVNGSCYCRGGLKKPSKSEEQTKLPLTISNYDVRKKEDVNISIYSNNSTSLLAIDMSFSIGESFDFVNVKSKLPNFSERSYFWDSGNRILRVLWLGNNKDYKLSIGQSIFDIEVKASENVQISNGIALLEGTENMLYGKEEEVELELNFDKKLFQYPITDLSPLPKNIDGDIYIYDTYGRLISQKHINLNDTNNTFYELGLSNGMYVYKFIAKNNEFSGKFIIQN